MIKYDLDLSKVALFVHDMQNVFLDEKSKYYSSHALPVLEKIKRLIKVFRTKNRPIIYTRVVMREDLLDWGLVGKVIPAEDMRDFVEGGTGTQVFPELAPSDDDIVIRKTSYSAFYNTNLEDILRNRGVDTLVVTGVHTEVGVESAVRDAFYRGVKVILPTDAIGSKDLPDEGWGEVDAEDVQKVCCTIMGLYFAELSTTDSVIERLGA